MPSSNKRENQFSLWQQFLGKVVHNSGFWVAKMPEQENHFLEGPHVPEWHCSYLVQ